MTYSLRHVTLIVLAVLVMSAALVPARLHGQTPQAPPKSAEPARKPGTAMALDGTNWRLTHLGKEAITTPASTRAASLQFHATERRVSGSTGCNRLSGRYKHDGQRLSLPPLETTRMICPDAIDIESRFLAALQKVARYRIVGSQLNLYDAKGVLLARFAARS
jgi:heat shock protein HslJ